MSQVSKHPVAKDVYTHIFSIFFKTIADVRTPDEVKEFFDDFLSPTERIMLAKRLSIAVLLGKGYDYRAVCRILHVSPSTVAAVSVFFRYSGKGYQKVVEGVIAAEQRKEFWNKIDDFLIDIVPPKGKDWRRWRYEREETKRKRRTPF